MIKRLKDRINAEDSDRATENEEFKAVEASLMTQIEGLQTCVDVSSFLFGSISLIVYVRFCSQVCSTLATRLLLGSSWQHSSQ